MWEKLTQRWPRIIKTDKCYVIGGEKKCDLSLSGNGWQRRPGSFSEAGAGRQLPEAEAGQGESNLEI